MTTLRGRGQTGDRQIAQPRGPMPRIFGRALRPIYARGIAYRNRKFDAGDGVETLPVPVISVGNLTVGGTGKTPMVMHICRELVKLNLQPCIAMRGYGAKPGTPSDEQDEYARQLPDVPVVAQPDRVTGIRALLSSKEGSHIDCVVLDDGFQHRRIARECDIVLIDASKPIHRDALLPAGWMREPMSSLARADAIVMTRTHDAIELDIALDAIKVIRPDLVPLLALNTWSQLQIFENGQNTTQQVSQLQTQSAFVVCAIGNPASFLNQCESHAGSVVGKLALRDHDPYKDTTVSSLIDQAASSRAKVIITTEKDWSKLRHVAPSRWPCPVVRPTVAVHLDDQGALMTLVSSVFSGVGTGAGV